jgi:hypothetical protein
MKVLKPLLWIMIGVIAGAASTVRARAVPVEAQVLPEHKLKWIASGDVPGSSPESWARFLYDPVSKACWLFLESTGGTVSLATAPESACVYRPGFSR